MGCENSFAMGGSKLASVIEEKDSATAHRDNQIQALEYINEKNQHKILRLNEEINDLIANRQVARHGCFDNVLCFIKKNSKEGHLYYII